MNKVCTKCGITKEDTEFDFRNDCQKLRLECSVCRSIQKHSYYESNKAKIFSRILERDYNITFAQLNKLLTEQGNRCAICGTKDPGGHGRFHIDHNHTCCPVKKKSCGKCIRGFLCSRCNMNIGGFNDDPQILQKAVDYLKKDKTKIITKAKAEWDGSHYVKTYEESYGYDGDLLWCCGAPAGQTNLTNSQTTFYNTLQQQLGTVFGASSSIFNELTAAFSPILAAGPSQTGFSNQELASLNSEAIQGVGQGYNNAKQAVGETIAAQGGGNAYLPSGAAIGANLSLAENAANQTSSELNQITQANYATGRQNWLAAAQGLAGAPGVFGAASNYAGAANQAGSAASQSWNNIANEQNSWVNALIGAGGGIAGSASGAAIAGFNSPVPDTGSFGEAGSYDIPNMTETLNAPGYSTGAGYTNF